MVQRDQCQRDQWDAYWGVKKVIILFADVADDGTMVVAPVELSQFVAQKSRRGRFGSVLYTFNRLHRIRRRFKHCRLNSLSRAHNFGSNIPGFLLRAFGSSRLPHSWRMRCRRLGPTQRRGGYRGRRRTHWGSQVPRGASERPRRGGGGGDRGSRRVRGIEKTRFIDN